MMRYHAIKLLCLLLLLGGCRPSGIEVNVRYDNIAGLTVERPVFFRSGSIGEVTSIDYTREGNYIVTLDIDRESADALTEHSRFFIIEDPKQRDEKAVEIRLSQGDGRPLADGALVTGSRESILFSQKLQEDIESGFQMFKQVIEEIGRDIRKIPETEEYHRLKRSLDALGQEMMKKEKVVRERIKREWLPKIQREMEALRKRLERLGRDEEMAPLDEQVEQLRRI